MLQAIKTFMIIIAVASAFGSFACVLALADSDSTRAHRKIASAVLLVLVCAVTGAIASGIQA